MSKNPPILKSYSPALLSLLPMLFAAWSDAVLTPSEIKLLKEKAGEINHLEAGELELLASWCNPRTPPSRYEFEQWEMLIVKAAQKLNSAGKKSLVDLGMEMAKQSARKADVKAWVNSAEKTALEELESALGLLSDETYQRLFEGAPASKEPPYSFDPSIITGILDGDTADFRKKVKRLLEDPVFKFKTLRSKKAYRDQVLEWCHLLAEQGYGAWAFPKEYGGQDNMREYIALFETMGYHDLSLAIKFGVQFGLFGGAVMNLGTEKHHKKYLEDTGYLRLAGCFAMTETGHGSNVRGLEVTATYDATTEEFVVHSPRFESGKEYIGNAMHSRMASVFAQLVVNGENHGVHAILVPLRDENHKTLPGVTVKDNGYKLGLNGVDNGRIWFDNVRVPRENLLDRFGAVSADGTYTSPIDNPSRRFFTMLGTLVGGRVCVPKAGLSSAKSALTIAIKYATKRRQFGANDQSPENLLLDYPSHQRRLMPKLAKAYACHFGLEYLADRYVNRTEEDIREIETLAAGMKSYATWFATETIQECREACGGKGYLAENRFADLKADTEIFTTFEGDNTVLMQLVAKGVLSAFNETFHSEGMMGILRFVGGRLSTSIVEKNPLTIRNTETEHLIDEDFHKQAFQYREGKLTYSVGQRLRGWIKTGISSYEAFLKCQTHLLALAEAYVERQVLEQFQKAVRETTDLKAKAALEKLVQLYALHTIEQHKGWYLEDEYMSPAKTKAIRRVVDQLCAEVRVDALGYVEAFDIPDYLLAAPIAM